MAASIATLAQRAHSMKAWSLPLLLCVLSVQPQAAVAKAYKLYYLGGQSNMDGYGHNAELPKGLGEKLEGVLIFHGNTAEDGQPVDGRGRWTKLRPGHGAGFSSDGQANKYSDRFGVELSFAAKLRELEPDTPIAIIKYSRGGTSIDAAAAGGFGCWEPDFAGGAGSGQGVNQYDHFLATLRGALTARDIDGDGEEDQLLPAGILWMQGESDAAYGPEIALRYEANLKRLADLIRAALHSDDLPIAIGRISDSGKDPDGKVWDHGPVVQAAQAAFVERDGRAALVSSTGKYGYSDPWHYDSAGYLDLGERFAEAIHGLHEKAAAGESR
jgi:hypothetical protein